MEIPRRCLLSWQAYTLKWLSYANLISTNPITVIVSLLNFGKKWLWGVDFTRRSETGLSREQFVFRHNRRVCSVKYPWVLTETSNKGLLTWEVYNLGTLPSISFLELVLSEYIRRYPLVPLNTVMMNRVPSQWPANGDEAFGNVTCGYLPVARYYLHSQFHVCHFLNFLSCGDQRLGCL